MLLPGAGAAADPSTELPTDPVIVEVHAGFQ